MLTIITTGQSGVEQGAAVAANHWGWPLLKLPQPKALRRAEAVLVLTEHRQRRFSKWLQESRKNGGVIVFNRHGTDHEIRKGIIDTAKAIVQWVQEDDIEDLFITGDDTVWAEARVHRLLCTVALALWHPGALPDEATETKWDKKRRLRKERREEKHRAKAELLKARRGERRSERPPRNRLRERL
jgi:hypothetical protein